MININFLASRPKLNLKQRFQEWRYKEPKINFFSVFGGFGLIRTLAMGAIAPVAMPLPVVGIICLLILFTGVVAAGVEPAGAWDHLKLVATICGGIVCGGIV
ncbi:hypothetical protein [Coleofasciculus sp. FACHB-T130]|uniref:hypothetical protein n=1 Tax=Cyanophyceae TaxID=3028117 RepID=UPI0016857DCC|nr:hypothetical protein [Coleofasciculus sp. FACHB-T130]MBD1879080.1 hypothetical protein [Coleofasciculus sp. FACHB-T130]